MVLINSKISIQSLSPIQQKPLHSDPPPLRLPTPQIRDTANCSSAIAASACRLFFSTSASSTKNFLQSSWSSASFKELARSIMHPPLTIHRHPMCAEIIEQFQKCHIDHPLGKFFGECTDLKIKLDKCFRQEKALRRKANFEESKKLKERLREYRRENLETRESKAFAQA